MNMSANKAILFAHVNAYSIIYSITSDKLLTKYDIRNVLEFMLSILTKVVSKFYTTSQTCFSTIIIYTI